MTLPDEVRFGARGILNLRDGLPSAAQAIDRTDRWLREHQVKGTKEVLVITGRGQRSVGGVAVVRPAVEKLLFALRRQGVVAGHAPYNPGAFVVSLASLRSLAEAPRRARERRPAPPGVQLHGLTTETIALLRDLAEQSLEALGVTPDDAAVEDEMHRHLRLLAPGLSSGAGMEDLLRAAIRSLIAAHDDQR